MSCTGQNRRCQIWTSCHNTGHMGWGVQLMCDHSWRPLPVRGRVVVQCSWVVLVNPDLDVLSPGVWHSLRAFNI
eukprot:15233031-Ditylum_brightwellii.AAC.1